MLMRAVTVVQQLCTYCRTCFKFYCMFHFTCDRSLIGDTQVSLNKRTAALSIHAHKLHQTISRAAAASPIHQVELSMTHCVRVGRTCQYKVKPPPPPTPLPATPSLSCRFFVSRLMTSSQQLTSRSYDTTCTRLEKNSTW